MKCPLMASPLYFTKYSTYNTRRGILIWKRKCVVSWPQGDSRTPVGLQQHSGVCMQKTTSRRRMQRYTVQVTRGKNSAFLCTYISTHSNSSTHRQMMIWDEKKNRNNKLPSIYCYNSVKQRKMPYVKSSNSLWWPRLPKECRTLDYMPAHTNTHMFTPICSETRRLINLNDGGLVIVKWRRHR